MPPVEAVYQSIVSPEPGVALRLITPVPHLAAPDPVGAVGTGFTRRDPLTLLIAFGEQVPLTTA